MEINDSTTPSGGGAPGGDELAPAPVRLTATAAARRLRVNRSTLWRWVKAGTIPEHRGPSGRPWYDPAELDAAMDGGAAPSDEKGTPGEGSQSV